MKITTKTRYGIRALVYIAENTEKDGELVRIKEVAEMEKVSVQYLEQILYKLKKDGIIEGKRGPNGGYKLAKTPEEINLYTIFKVLESEVKVVICEPNSEKCVKERCSSLYLWDKINGKLEKMLKETTLAEMIGAHKEKIAKLCKEEK